MTKSNPDRVLIAAIVLSLITAWAAFSEEGRSQNAEPAVRIDGHDTAAATVRRKRGKRERGRAACEIVEACKDVSKNPRYEDVCENFTLMNLYSKRCEDFKVNGL